MTNGFVSDWSPEPEPEPTQNETSKKNGGGVRREGLPGGVPKSDDNDNDGSPTKLKKFLVLFLFLFLFRFGVGEGLSLSNQTLSTGLPSFLVSRNPCRRRIQIISMVVNARTTAYGSSGSRGSVHDVYAKKRRGALPS